VVITYPDGEEVDLLFDKRLHSYKVGEEIVPSATKVLGVISKPALVPWALKMGVEWFEGKVFKDEESSANGTHVYKSPLGLDSIIKGIKSAHRQTSTSAINIGTITHDWVEDAINFHIKGGVIPELPTQEEALNSIDAFKAWVQENDIEWISAEEKLYHRKHKYAGTVDALANINGEYCVIDWKTSKAVYPEYHLQVAAYAKAVEDMYEKKVDATYILRCDKVTGRFEAVRSTDIAKNFRAFLAALTLYKRLKEIR
jgi:hypothetical protein